MFQWLRIEPAYSEHTGTEDIELALLYLLSLHTSTEQLHVYQEMEGDHIPALLVVHVIVYKPLKSVKYLLLLTDCKGESGSLKPAMLSEAICKELGSWLGKSGVRENCRD